MAVAPNTTVSPGDQLVVAVAALGGGGGAGASGNEVGGNGGSGGASRRRAIARVTGGACLVQPRLRVRSYQVTVDDDEIVITAIHAPQTTRRPRPDR